MVIREFRKPVTILGCNYLGNPNEFTKAFENTASKYIQYTGKPLICNQFGSIFFTSPKNNSRVAKWNLFVALEDPQLIDELKHVFIPYHYISTIPQCSVLKCVFENKHRFSVLNGMMKAQRALDEFLYLNHYDQPTGYMEMFNNTDSEMEFMYFLNRKKYFDSLQQQPFCDMKMYS